MDGVMNRMYFLRLFLKAILPTNTKLTPEKIKKQMWPYISSAAGFGPPGKLGSVTVVVVIPYLIASLFVAKNIALQPIPKLDFNQGRHDTVLPNLQETCIKFSPLEWRWLQGLHLYCIWSLIIKRIFIKLSYCFSVLWCSWIVKHSVL